MSAQPLVQERHGDRPRLAFVGLGWIGRKRLDAAVAWSDIEIAALADADSSCLEAAALACPQAAAVLDIDSALACDVDGVVIATPNGLHAAQAIACLESGVPVFCQKPLATTAADAERVIAAAQCADRLLGIDFCYRHVNGMAELRRRIAAGALGEIVAVDLVFHNAYGPDKSWCRDPHLAGGGCLLDLGVHLLDLTLWLQGSPPIERVRSRRFAGGEPVQGRPQSGGALEDFACAEFIQANGAVVRLACSWHAHIGQDAVISATLTGTRAGAEWRNVAGSFYDFELDLLHGAQRERIGTHPDDWGPRALRQWVERLRVDRSFDPEAQLIARSAALIDEIYRA